MTAAVSAHFILANSAAGLAGHLSSVAHVHPIVPVWALIAAMGDGTTAIESSGVKAIGSHSSSPYSV